MAKKDYCSALSPGGYQSRVRYLESFGLETLIRMAWTSHKKRLSQNITVRQAAEQIAEFEKRKPPRYP